MQSVVSYPDRGRFGKSSYRGNCSGKLIEDIIDQYHLSSLSDFMVGSGTTEDVVNSPYPLIVVVENDIGKVLGNALAAELGDGKDIVSIDGISVANGDYIDIGEPIAGGHVVPVVVKTLIFNS